MKIACKRGAAEVDVGGTTYHFAPDEKGRFVADVHHKAHQRCLLAVEHYEEVLDEETSDDPSDESADIADPYQDTLEEPRRRGRKPRT